MLRPRSLVFVIVAAGSCMTEPPGDELAAITRDIDVIEPDPGAAGITIISRPCQWSTTDGSPGDTGCVAGETAVADAAGGCVCVIGTHGGVGEIQCMPPNDVFGGSGATHLLCSVCYAGSPTTISGEGSTAQCLAEQQGVPCENVIACTGPVTPMGDQPTPGGTGTCATMRCDGTWVNGCAPPMPINPSTPGVCYTTGHPPSYPIPTAVTVGCFTGDLPSDVWRRCRDRYRNHVTDPGVIWDTTCADEWADADPTSSGFQECQALVRACIAQTRGACAQQANAAAAI